MNTLQIQNFSVEELKDIISDTIKEELQNHSSDGQNQATAYLTRKQVSEMLQVSYVTLWNWEKEGILRGYRIGNQIRYKRDEIENSLQDLYNQKNKKK